MPQILSVLRVLTAFAVVIMVGLLCWQCIDIYLDGNAPENLDTNGVHLTSVFRMDDVARRLKALAAPLSACTIVIVTTAVLHCCAGERLSGAFGSISPGKHRRIMKARPCAQAGKAVAKGDSGSFVRVGLIVLAVVFIVLGVVNGGLYDVWVKAVNICTECIGLG